MRPLVTAPETPRLPHKFYPAQQVRQHEGEAALACGCDLYQLMERAGNAAFTQLQNNWPDVRHVLVLCGHGNNGGDGFVVARLAKEAGLDVRLYHFGDADKSGDDAQLAKQKWLDINGSICTDNNIDFSGMDVVVDALLGTGIKGAVRSPYLSVIEQVNQASLPVLSVDIPSGIDADSGQVCEQAIKAEITSTMVALKAGLLTGTGRQYSGFVQCDSLGIKQQFAQRAQHSGIYYGLDNIAPLPKKPLNSHKGNFGRLLCIGGDRTMPGAIRLSAEAALRTGTGLVKVLCHPDSRMLVHSGLPELMLCDDQLDLTEMLSWSDAIILGPGLGSGVWGLPIFEQLIHHYQTHPLPMVIDADGLNLLAKHSLPLSSHCILTPHPGEAARLLNCSVNDIESDRLNSAKALADKYQCQIILKGAGTVVCTTEQLAICKEGNPGMATAGMGDTLTGIIGALLAQGQTSQNASLHATALHAKAGDVAAQQGGEYGMLASDLIRSIRQLVNR